MTVPVRPLLAAAMIAAALVAQLLLFSSTEPVGAVAMRAAEKSGDARAASVSMSKRYPVRGRTMLRAATVATRYWHMLPCGGHVDIRWEPMAMNTNAVATWRSPGGVRDPRRYSGCRISFNSRIAFSWARLCTAMGHEVGHLLGQRHTRRAGRFMSETYRRPAPQCR